jgi:hypothetical protein
VWCYAFSQHGSAALPEHPPYGDKGGLRYVFCDVMRARFARCDRCPMHMRMCACVCACMSLAKCCGTYVNMCIIHIRERLALHMYVYGCVYTMARATHGPLFRTTVPTVSLPLASAGGHAVTALTGSRQPIRTSAPSARLY